MQTKKPLFLLLAALLLLTVSCSSRQKISVTAEGSISGRISIKLSDVFMEYIRDLSEAAGTGRDEVSVFDTQQISASFKEFPDIILEKISVPRPSELTVDFKMKNALTGLEKTAAASILQFSSSGAVKKFVFNLNGENYKSLSRAFALEDNPVLSGLTPYPENPYSEKEYIELLEYVFSDYPGGRNIKKTLEGSFIEIEVETSGTVIKADGGTFRGNKALFSIPVIKFLTLEKPVVLSVEFR